jgi:hypothetical protein
VDHLNHLRHHGRRAVSKSSRVRNAAASLPLIIAAVRASASSISRSSTRLHPSSIYRSDRSARSRSRSTSWRSISMACDRVCIPIAIIGSVAGALSGASAMQFVDTLALGLDLPFGTVRPVVRYPELLS